MNLYFSPLFYMFFMVSSTIMVISSSSMFTLWLGLEINLMSFIPMMGMISESKKNTEASIKYFLIQSISSSLVLFSLLWFFLFSNSEVWNCLSLILNISLSVKMGLAPFHLWFPEVMEGLSWINSLILMTWQKISPMIVMSMVYNFKFMMFLAMISAMTGAVSGLNQTSLRKILAYSSISHMGWMISIMILNSYIWISYLAMYMLVSFMSCMSFWFFDMNFINQMFFQKNNSLKMLVFLNLLSTGGMPPLMGFTPKMLAFKIISSNFPILIILMSSSLITLYFYTRMCMSAFTLSQQNMKSNLKNKEKKLFMINSISAIISMTGILPISMLIL
uniref:NADH dehydrogenase subunit 2 n=1 Tax=Glyptelasma gigas TaxID=2358227 RepID=UPI0021CC98DC|nr:NADH dehydrogenase subunit 2 [Glyptelasma gigas]UWM12895.1 NADH dehydrogenase subunit 2 [Glyptelasma gigas]